MNAAERFQAKVLLTRPAEQSKDLVALLIERGAQPVICPVIEIVHLIHAEELREAWSQWRTSVDRGLVVLTSARTVEFLVKAGIRIDQVCSAVGPRTKQSVADAGWQSAPVDATDGASLAAELTKAGYGGADVWLPCSKRAATDFEDSLRREGSRVTRVDVYEPRPSTEQLRSIARDDQAFDVIVFHSPSAVDATVDAIGANRLAGVQVVCVGQSTSSQAEQRGLQVSSVAKQPTDAAMVDAIAATVAAQSSIIGAS
jgi:uroporphyrinogen III methyltransferase/synthase